MSDRTRRGTTGQNHSNHSRKNFILFFYGIIGVIEGIVVKKIAGITHFFIVWVFFMYAPPEEMSILCNYFYTFINGRVQAFSKIVFLPPPSPPSWLQNILLSVPRWEFWLSQFRPSRSERIWIWTTKTRKKYFSTIVTNNSWIKHKILKYIKPYQNPAYKSTGSRNKVLSNGRYLKHTKKSIHKGGKKSTKKHVFWSISSKKNIRLYTMPFTFVYRTAHICLSPRYRNCERVQRYQLFSTQIWIA